MEINIYWNDLVEEFQENLLEEGFEPQSEVILEQKPLGTLRIEDSTEGESTN